MNMVLIYEITRGGNDTVNDSTWYISPLLIVDYIIPGSPKARDTRKGLSNFWKNISEFLSSSKFPNKIRQKAKNNQENIGNMASFIFLTNKKYVTLKRYRLLNNQYKCASKRPQSLILNSDMAWMSMHQGKNTSNQNQCYTLFY